jgi:hypothetical protein
MILIKQKKREVIIFIYLFKLIYNNILLLSLIIASNHND